MTHRPGAGSWFWRAGSALFLLLLLTLLGNCDGCELVTGAKHQLRLRLRSLASDGWRDLASEDHLKMSFVISAIEVNHDTGFALVRADASGRYHGVETHCLCVERIAFKRGASGWQVDGFPLPRLAAVVEVLEARKRAFEGANYTAYRGLVHPAYEEEGGGEAVLKRLRALLEDGPPSRQEITERVLRVEKRHSIVTESYIFSTQLGEETLQHKGRSRQILRLTPDGWRFVSGLL